MPQLSELPHSRQAAIRFGRRADWIIAAVIMVVAVGFIYLLRNLPQRATFFPWFITISILTVGTAYAVGKLRSPSKWDAQYDPETETEHGEHDTGPAFLVPYMRGIARALAIFAGLVLATIAFGPEFAVPVFLAGSLWIAGENRLVAVLSGAGFWLVIHYVFGSFMSINLPVGFLVAALP